MHEWEAVAMGLVADALARHVDSGDVPGAVAVVARGDEVDISVVGDQAYGGAAMRPDSLFRIASAGKPITAAAALSLVADGRLTLTDAVGDLLPELASPRVLRVPTGALDDAVPVARPITVRDLLRSTNGHGFPGDFSAPVVEILMQRLHQGPPRPQLTPPPDEWMARLAAVPLVHQPGEGFTYNTSYDILGVLVSRAAGRPFADYVTQRILQPLGMTDTGFTFPTRTAERTTSYYRRAADGSAELVDAPDGQWATEPAFASGAGGYVSTVADLLAFQRMLLHGGDILPAELVTAMTTDQLTPDIRATNPVFLNGQSWGFGGGVDVERRQPWNVPGRYGWVGGTGTSTYIVPADGSVAIVLTQMELGGPVGAPVLETFWRTAAADLGHG
jgi:CubicO group peptidase (beta-lactamase class C family)